MQSCAADNVTNNHKNKVLPLWRNVLIYFRQIANHFAHDTIGDRQCEPSKEVLFWCLSRCTSDSDPWLWLQLKLVRLVGMMLVVFVRKNISNNIRGMRAGTIGTGIMGMMVGVGIVECWLSKSPPGCPTTSGVRH